MRLDTTAPYILLCLAGCSVARSVAPAPAPAPARAPTLAPATAPTPAVAAEPEPVVAAPKARFVVRYACDDKYALESECRPGKTEWSAWLAALDVNAGAANLLEHGGGGPSGAEWNLAAPLAVFVANEDAAKTRLELTRKTAFVPAARLDGYDVFWLPFAAWQAASRPARAADLADAPAVDGIRVVELRALQGTAELGRGTVAFSSGE